MKQLKKLLGNNAHWTINKELAKNIGLDATIVLQHFIDLQYSFFEDGGFYQQQQRLLADLPLTIDYLRKATKVLENKGFLSIVKRGVPAKNHYTVHEENILTYLSDITSSASEAPLEVSQKDDLTSTRDTTNTKNKDTKNKDTNLDATRQDGKNKPDIEILLDKIIERYPGSINSRGPMLKALKQLNTEERKLALKNIDRYTKAWEGWYHNLRNYLESKQFSESELTKRETKQKANNTSTKGIDTKNFDTNY